MECEGCEIESTPGACSVAPGPEMPLFANLRWPMGSARTVGATWTFKVSCVWLGGDYSRTSSRKAGTPASGTWKSVKGCSTPQSVKSRAPSGTPGRVASSSTTDRHDSAPVIRRTSAQCFNCGDIGHLRHRCEVPLREDSYCFNCGRESYTMRDCP